MFGAEHQAQAAAEIGQAAPSCQRTGWIGRVAVELELELRAATAGGLIALLHTACGLMRTISASIQASARSVISLAVSPAGSMAGPMLTVTMPHFLNKALRPQNSPEFSATGTTGVPVSTARWAPPIL
jgi:hypothetical protein